MDVGPALASCGGAAQRGRLLQLGVSRHRLLVAVRAGSVVAIGGGGYALPSADLAVVRAVRLRGLVSHVSAAHLHGLEVWLPHEQVHVTVPRGARRRLSGVRVHRAELAPGDRHPTMPATSLIRTLIDCGRTLSLPEAVTVLDSALRAGMITRSELERVARSTYGPGATKVRRALHHADPRCGSPLESPLRVLLELLGLHVLTQVRIPGVGIVDFLVDGWLVIEADGFEYHAERAAYREDRRRANALVERGYVLLRFTWEDVRLRPEWVVAQVKRVHGRRPAGTRATH